MLATVVTVGLTVAAAAGSGSSTDAIVVTTPTTTTISTMTSRSPPSLRATNNSSTNISGADAMLAASVGCSGCQQCAPEHDTCGKPFWWAWWEVPCCDGLQCQYLYGGIAKVCVKPQAQCVPLHDICGGPGQHTQECCGTAVCHKLYGGDKMECVEENVQQQCVDWNKPCDYDNKCCDGYECSWANTSPVPSTICLGKVSPAPAPPPGKCVEWNKQCDYYNKCCEGYKCTWANTEPFKKTICL